MTEVRQWHVEGVVPRGPGAPRRTIRPEHLSGIITRVQRPTHGETVELDDGHLVRVYAVSLSDEEMAAAREKIHRFAGKYELEPHILWGRNSYGTTTLEASFWLTSVHSRLHVHDGRVANYSAWDDFWTSCNGTPLDEASGELDAYLAEFTRNPRNPIDVLAAVRYGRRSEDHAQ